MSPRMLVRPLVIGAVLLMGIWAIIPAVEANLLHRDALNSLEISDAGVAAVDSSWERGWTSICAADTADVSPGTKNAFTALALLENGRYRAALQDFSALSAAELPNAPAFAAALEMEWTTAATLYQPEPTARNMRWWGSIFYLAAQQQLFAGNDAAAAELYRRADAAYGVQGPHTGLALVDCLEQAGRFTEAWDALRRVLFALTPDEALAHLARYERLRQAGLAQWHRQQPDDERVAGWLAAYASLPLRDGNPRPLASAPEPDVTVRHELGDGATLLGFDYRPVDIETGPFMDIILYWQEDADDTVTYWQAAHTVLNQAPNGSFSWDNVPDGVRPFGWHAFVYTPDPTAIVREGATLPAPWLCLDAGRVGDSFGLQSLPAALGERRVHLQGGQLYAAGSSNLSLGRQWYGVLDPNNYSYVGGRPEPDTSRKLAGLWKAPVTADESKNWIIAHQSGTGCFRDLFLIDLPQRSN